MDDMRNKILNWFANGRVGASSKAMACCLIGAETDRSYPYDPDDFNRCLLFLKDVPEAREHMDSLRSMSVVWDVLIDKWEEIERSFLDEVGLNWHKSNRAPKTYELMDNILKGARQKPPEQ